MVQRSKDQVTFVIPRLMLFPRARQNADKTAHNVQLKDKEKQKTIKIQMQSVASTLG